MSVLKFITLIDNSKQIDIFGDGKQTRSFTFIEDVVEGIIKSLELIKSETINIESNKNYQLNDVIKMMEKFLDKKAIKKLKKSNLFEMTNTLADTKKAYQLLSWKPKIDLEKGIYKTVNWYTQNKELVNKIV